jgi:hypothetical protein
VGQQLLGSSWDPMKTCAVDSEQYDLAALAANLRAVLTRDSHKATSPTVSPEMAGYYRGSVNALTYALATLHDITAGDYGQTYPELELDLSAEVAVSLVLGGDRSG